MAASLELQLPQPTLPPVIVRPRAGDAHVHVLSELWVDASQHVCTHTHYR